MVLILSSELVLVPLYLQSLLLTVLMPTRVRVDPGGITASAPPSPSLRSLVGLCPDSASAVAQVDDIQRQFSFFEMTSF